MNDGAKPGAQAPEGAAAAPDLREKGLREGQPVFLDRRLFMKFTAYGGCRDPGAAIEAVARSGLAGALYVDANDPQGLGLMAMSEDPDYFATTFRELLNRAPFADLRHKPEFDMLGRTYSIGYEPDLEDALFTRPTTRIVDPALRWAVWYPLRRAKSFAALDADHQRRVFAEHGTLGKRFGAAGHAYDVRLACHGLDRNDNDFIIGLLGRDLFPLSAVVQAMRRTEQTARYLESLGPFFVGRVGWQSGGSGAAE